MSKNQSFTFMLYACQLNAYFHNVPIPPLQMILYGCAGTGKSYIIKAVQDYLDILHKKEYMQVAAFTGSASASIGGSTIHRAMYWKGISYKTACNTIQSDHYTDKMITTYWKRLSVLMIDEWGVLTGKMLLGIHRTVSQYRALPNESLFAKLNVLFLGDPNQLPPVMNFPLYQNWSKAHERCSTQTREHIDGQNLWRSIPYAMKLNEPKRFEPDYEKFITNFENGFIEPYHIERLNARR
jgi:hypothetical protein